LFAIKMTYPINKNFSMIEITAIIHPEFKFRNKYKPFTMINFSDTGP
jgi:hypothetical protein